MSTVMKLFIIHPKTKAPNPLTIGNTLGDVYGRYSDAKADAYHACKKLCERCDGYNFRITSANTFAFTVSFDFINPDDNRAMRAIITPTYNHAYYLD